MSRHLTPDEIVDLLDGRSDEIGRSHLAECDGCRRVFDDARAALAVIGADEVPEPSPLFWQHAAARVRAAIDEEPAPVSRWRVAPVAWVGGLAAATLVAWLAVRPSPPASSPPVAPPAMPHAVDARDPSPLDDESWAVISALGSDLDVEAVAQSGLVAAGDMSDRALLVLDDDERMELGALLENELRRPGI